MHSTLLESLEQKSYHNNTQSMTATELLEMNKLYSAAYRKEHMNDYATTGLSTGNTKSSLSIIDSQVTDGWSEGAGNAGLTVDLEEGTAKFNAFASIYDTKYDDKDLGTLRAQMLYADWNAGIPTTKDSFIENVVYSQNIGAKIEAGVSKVTVANDNFPLSGNFNFAQLEGKLNLEDYTFNAGAGATAVKIETKFELYDILPIDEWLDFEPEYEPYLGIDYYVGSVTLGGSVGMENSIYGAFGNGFGIKFGTTPADEN